MLWDWAEKHAHGWQLWCGSSVFFFFFFKAGRKEAAARAGGDCSTFKSPWLVFHILDTNYVFVFLCTAGRFLDSYFNVAHNRSVRASWLGSFSRGGGGTGQWRAMAVEARPELVGKRFLCVGGDEPPELGTIARWPWRSGVIRAVNHRDGDPVDLTVRKRRFVLIFYVCVATANGGESGLLASSRCWIIPLPGTGWRLYIGLSCCLARGFCHGFVFVSWVRFNPPVFRPLGEPGRGGGGQTNSRGWWEANMQCVSRQLSLSLSAVHLFQLCQHYIPRNLHCGS